MHLLEKDKQALIKIFPTVHIPFEIWAYGSRVTGDAHDGSDLDLVMRGLNIENIPLEVISNLRDKIDDSTIPILVELRDWARIAESFHRNIEKNYEVMYDNREQFEKSMHHLILNEPTAAYIPNLQQGSEIE